MVPHFMLWRDRMKIVINPKYQSLTTFIGSIEDYFENSEDILYDQRNLIKGVSYQGQDYVVKRFKISNFINRIVYRYFRASKAQRSFDYSLKIGGILCPEPIAYLEEGSGGLLGTSYYISKRYSYDFTIRPVLLDKCFDKKLRQNVLIAFAEFTFSLHEKGILHRDYSYGNILIKQQEAKFYFNIIDVNRMQFRQLSLNDRLENFARLSADNEAMLVIITRYAELINKPVTELLPVAAAFRDEYMRKRKLKNKLRGR